jgi:hypothetical protein
MVVAYPTTADAAGRTLPAIDVMGESMLIVASVYLVVVVGA